MRSRTVAFPKLTIITGGSYGAGNYALCGKAFDPRLIWAWPTARYAVMGAEQATNTLAKSPSKVWNAKGPSLMLPLSSNFANKSKPLTNNRPMCATLLPTGWVDGIIDPRDTAQC